MLLVLPVDGHEGEMLVQMRDVATVDQGSRGGLCRSNGVTSVDALFGELHRELIILCEGWILAYRFPEEAMNVLVDGPDGSGTEW